MSDLIERFERGRVNVKRSQLLKTRSKIARSLRKLFGIAYEPKVELDAEAHLDPDPLFDLCSEELPAGPCGRLGLFYRELKRIPRFSEMLLHPQKTCADLEDGLSEASDVYPTIGTTPLGKWLPCFVFVVNEKAFVYTGAGEPADMGNVMALKVRGKTRFVCELETYVAWARTGGTGA